MANTGFKGRLLWLFQDRCLDWNEKWRLNCLLLFDGDCGWGKLCGGLDGKIYGTAFLSVEHLTFSFQNLLLWPFPWESTQQF